MDNRQVGTKSEHWLHGSSTSSFQTLNPDSICHAHANVKAMHRISNSVMSFKMRLLARSGTFWMDIERVVSSVRPPALWGSWDR